MKPLFDVKKKKFYAYSLPASGQNGVTESWAVCEKYVKGVSGAQFKSFATRQQAQSWLSGVSAGPAPKKNSFYAYVVAGGVSGICRTWDECKEKIAGQKDVRYKRFDSRLKAQDWVAQGGPKEKAPKLEAGIYFDAGTGRGAGVEVSVTDEKGKDLLHKAIPSEMINPHGKKTLDAEATNNLGELLALKYALLIAKDENKKRIFGDSKLVIDYWSRGRIRKEMNPETARIAHEVSRLREEFERSGGIVSRISGKYNPADLGFHR